MSAGAPIAKLAWQEVVALHKFFEDWFRGTDDAPDFSSCDRALGPEFRIIEPDGVTRERAEIIDRLRSAHGKSPANLRIVVSDPRTIWAGEGAVLLEYTEQQYRDGRTTRRRSTALLLASPEAPRGVVWRHLQETWMDVA